MEAGGEALQWWPVVRVAGIGREDQSEIWGRRQTGGDSGIVAGVTVQVLLFQR